MRFLAPLLLALALTLPAFAQVAFPPVDQAAQQPDFLAFRRELQRIVAARDAKALLRHVAPDLQFSYGAVKPGPAGFAKQWKLDRPRTSYLWEPLGRVLSHGGAFTDANTFSAPYWSSQWPEDKDPSEWGALVGTAIPVHAQPSRNSPVLAELSPSLVELGREGRTDNGWFHVILPPEVQNARKVESGFVAPQSFGSPYGYRATFEKRTGRWWMTSFIAGD